MGRHVQYISAWTSHVGAYCRDRDAIEKDMERGLHAHTHTYTVVDKYMHTHIYTYVPM